MFIIESPRDKTNKMTVPPAKTQINLGIRPVWSESSLWAQWVAKGSLGPKLSSCGQRRLIRLGGCPGWSESSLGGKPHCWFCCEAAHIRLPYMGDDVLLILLHELRTEIGTLVGFDVCNMSASCKACVHSKNMTTIDTGISSLLNTAQQ